MTSVVRSVVTSVVRGVGDVSCERCVVTSVVRAVVTSVVRAAGDVSHT